MPDTKPMTADQLLHLDRPDKRAELIRGRLVVREPAGAWHGRVANDMAFFLTQSVKTTGLGRIYAAETGFHVEQNPDTVRAPDVAFVSNERLSGPDPVAFPRFAPDLAVEVLSPGDHPAEVLEKVGTCLSGRSRS